MQLDTWGNKTKKCRKKGNNQIAHYNLITPSGSRHFAGYRNCRAVLLTADERRQPAGSRHQAPGSRRVDRRISENVGSIKLAMRTHAFYEYRLFGIRHGVQTVSKCNPVSVSVSVSVSITGSFSTTNTKAKNKRHNYFLCTAFAVTLNADLWVLS